MSFRIPAIQIPANQPFAEDKLGRRELVNFVSNIIKQAEGEPLVLTIDGAYGSGKSTFVLMLQAVLQAEDYQTVYFDAWRADHVSDPLIALVASLDSSLPTKNAGRLQAGISRVKRVATVLGKRAIVAGVKIGTAGIVDLPTDIEKIFVDAAGEGAKDLVELYQAETKLIESFRDELENVVIRLDDLQKKPVLIFFIDELDRCRPDFAISLLERIKHMFDVANVVFVLSVDKKQLEGAASAVYGEKINAPEYLRKFIDIEFELPVLPSREFVASIFARSNLDLIFANRTLQPIIDKDNFSRLFLMLADIFELGLRAQERCILRLKLVLLNTRDDEPLMPLHLALLIVIRLVSAKMFWGVARKNVDAAEIEQFIRKSGRVGKYESTREWDLLMGLLIAEDVDPVARQNHITNLEVQMRANQVSIPARATASVVSDMRSLRLEPGEGYEKLAKKIDLAARAS